MANKRPSPREYLRMLIGPYRELFPFLRPHLGRFILALVFGAFFGVISGLLPLVLNHVNSQVFPQGKNKAEMLSDAVNGTGAGINSVLLVCSMIPFIFVLRSLCDYLNSYYMAWVALRVLADIRRRLYTHIIGQSLEFFNRERSGTLISRVANDTQIAQLALTSISSDLIKQPLTVISAFAVLIHLDWKFTVVSLFLFPVCIVPIVYFGKKVRRQGKLEEQKIGSMMSVLQESFAGIRVIKAFAREKRESEQFGALSLEQFRSGIRVRKAIEIVSPMVEAVSAIGVGLALFYVWSTHLSAAKFLALLAGIFMLYDPIKKLSRIHLVMQQCFNATNNIFEIMNREPVIKDRPEAVEITGSKGDIRLESVTFRYRPGLPAAIRDLSLHIEPGKYYALVGSSGAGKSTILSLLLRFYEPEAGVIRLDGRDVNTIKQTSLREQIGMVSQDTFLFHDSILNNIRYGRLNATKEEVIEAAKRAYAHDFIMHQPNGYETVIGDKGCLLSGGQQQRVSIARALLKNAPVLLLDEAMSALDSEAEREIQAALDRLSEGRTVIAIAHRLSTVLKADQIVVMDRGEIREIGMHRELLESSTIYRKLYDLQFNVQAEELATV
ncbi:MAG: ABC transporter ATP-binding protein [Verrucomicrobia bacterium]|jgi:ATP-binding cassette, subfamily B, bacterial MsbA|nr:ABC transporter ATP-binding protein [Verrucomicrobiota bacterium]